MKTKEHYHALAGLHGCMPNSNEPCEDYENAVQCLSHIHELSKKRESILRKDGHLKLNIHKDGNEYCKITECNMQECFDYL